MEIPATTLSSLLLLAGGLAAIALYTLVALKRPWFATAVALVSLALIPFWIGVNISVFFVSAHLVLLAVAALSILANRLARIRLHAVDLVLLLVYVVTLAAMVPGLTTIHQGYTFSQWLLAYWFARIAAEAFGIRRLATVLALAFPVTAVTMVVEWVSGTNPWHTFMAVDNAAFHEWSALQSRGGVLRAEGPFGHSIAAGSVLAVAAILTLDAKLPVVLRVQSIAVMAIGIGLTISRISMITAALGITLTIIATRSSLTRRARILTLGALIAVATVTLVLLRDVFAISGAEAANSASYRYWLLDLLPTLNPVGYAASYNHNTAGTTSFGSFGSVDSAVLFFALTHGWIPAVIMLGLMGAAVLHVLRLRGGVAAAAVVAQVPALFSVALITSYSLVFWMSVGLAVAEAIRAGSNPLQTDAVTPTTNNVPSRPKEPLAC